MTEPVKRKDRRKQAAVPQFVPDTEELVQLAKYWFTETLDMTYFFFVYSGACSDDIEYRRYAFSRLNKIANHLDDAAVKKAKQDAEDEFAKTVDPEAWQIFLHGTPEARKAFQIKVDAELEAKDDDEFYADLMRFIAGEPCSILPGSVGMSWAEITKELIEREPELANPENKNRLFKRLYETSGDCNWERYASEER